MTSCELSSSGSGKNPNFQPDSMNVYEFCIKVLPNNSVHKQDPDPETLFPSCSATEMLICTTKQNFVEAQGK